MTISKQAHIHCANIVIDYAHLIHIGKEHIQELTQLNITAYDYVKLICSNFNEIRKGTGNSIMLIRRNPIPPHDTCCIRLEYNIPKNTWFIKTAQPREHVENRQLIWIQKR